MPAKARSVVFLAIGCLLLNACAFSPLTNPRLAQNPPEAKVQQLSVSGKLSIEAHAQEDIADMSSIYLMVRNETESNRVLDLTRISAVTADGRRVPVIPAQEASRQAGDAGVAPGMVKGGAVGLGIGALIGGAMGAVIGAAFGVPGSGAAIGAGIGGGTGAAAGIGYGGTAGNLSSREQVLNLHLRDQVVKSASAVTGYVFLPKDNYTHLSVIMSSGPGEEDKRDLEITVPLVTDQESSKER